MAGNYFDQFDEAPKTSSNFFDQFDEEDTAAPAKKKKAVSGSAGVPVPSPSFIGASVKEAPKITGPDHWLNVIPQGVGEAAAGIAGLGGVAVDTALNLPRSMLAATLPRSAYESIYGTAPEVPFTATTDLGANIAQSVRAGTEDVFPAPLANKRFQAELAAGDGGIVDAATAAWNNPMGAVQEMAKQAVTTATLSPAVGILPAIGIMEGGAPEQAGAAFDEEWKQGIPQKSAAYQELAAAVGPEEAHRILRTQRMQRSSQYQAVVGAAAGKLSEAFGGMELEKVLAGQAAKTFGVKEVAKQALSEVPEEAAVAIAGNLASQDTGNPTLGTMQGVGGAATLGLIMGGGQSAAIGGVQAGAKYTQSLLDSTGAKSAKTPPIVPPAVDTVDKRTAVTGFQNQGLDPNALAAKPAIPSFVTTLMNAEQQAKFLELQDPAARQKMVDDITAAKQAAAVGTPEQQAARARAAADRDWLSKNEVTSHPEFADAEAVVLSGVTSVAQLRKQVPTLSRYVASAIVDHFEKQGVLSAPDKARKRTLLVAPTLTSNIDTKNNSVLKDNIDAAIQPAISDTVQPTVPSNIVDQKSSVTLPEVGRSIAQEPEVVNTPAPTQTETVQAKTPKVGSYQPVAGGYESRVTAHTLGSNALDPTADAGALIYEYRKEGQAGPPMTMVVGKSGKLIPASQAVTGNKSSGEAWIPPTKDAGDAVRALLLNRGNLDAAGRAENSAQIAAIVAPRVEPKGPIRLKPMPAKVAEAPATLPAALAGAKPRYGFGSNNHQLTFASDVDKAAYVLAQAKPSKQDAQYLAFVVGATGMSETEARAYGATVREGIKQQAKTLTTPGTIAVPDGRAAALVERSTAPAEVGGATTLPAPTQNEPVALPVQPQTPVEDVPPPAVTGLTPETKKRRQSARKPVPVDANKEAAIAKAQAEIAADTAEKARIDAKIPSDADFTMAGMSPGEIALAKKTKPQDIFDAVNRGEISTPQGMRPVTDADIKAAKTRPDKERLTRLKDKYEKATDAPRKLDANEVRNVDKEAIAAAYVRIQALANKPGMKQHEAIVADPESSKSILGLKSGALTTTTTSAELAKKLEDTYVENYTRNNPEAAQNLAPRGWDTAGTTPEGDAANAADTHIRDNVSNGKQALEAVASGAIPASAAIQEMARRLMSVSDMSDVAVTLRDDAASNGLVRPDGSTVAGRYDTETGVVDVLSATGGRTEDVAEVLVHEVAHAGTVRAMIKLESGELVDQELSDLLEDMKIGLTELRRRLDAKEVRDPEGRVVYASKNIYELVATVFASPRAARRLDDARVTIPRRGARRGRVATVLQIIRDFVAKVFPKLSPAQVDTILLSTRIREAVERMSANSRVRTEFTATPEAYDADASLRKNSRSDKAVTARTTEAPATTSTHKPLTDTSVVGLTSVANRILDAGFGLVRNRGIASTSAQEMIEKRAGIQEAMLTEAESAIEQVKQELVDALAGASKATAGEYRKNILKYLKGDKSVPLPGALSKRIDELRKLIDDRSLAMIAMGLVPKDKIATVLKNIGKWTHRDYKVFHLRPGVNNKTGEYKKLNATLALMGKADIVKENIEAIKDDMRIPSAKDLKALARVAKDKAHKDHDAAVAQLKEWARRWRITETKKLTGKNSVVARLAAISALGEEHLQKEAVDYANFLLDPEYKNAPANVRAEFDRYAGVHADDSALTQDRTPMPKWLKNLWGEYTDWETISMLSLDNQAKIISKFAALTTYKAELLQQGKAFKAGENPGRSRKGYTLLDGKIYGPLDGYYIPQEDLWLIQSANTVSAIDTALGAREIGDNSWHSMVRKYMTAGANLLSPIGSFFKVNAVLLNHVTAGINALSSTLLLSGAMPRLYTTLKAIPNGFKIARASSFGGVGIRTATTGPMRGVGMIGRALENGTELQRQLLFLQSNKVLHDAALSADMKRQFTEQLTAEIDSMLLPHMRATKFVLSRYSWMRDRFSRVNSFGDEIAKYISWASRVEHLKDIDPSMTQDEVERLAAKQVRATMPSFMDAMPIARAISNSGLIDPFLTFNTEQLRNAVNSAKLAAKYGFSVEGRAAKIYAASEAISVMTRLAAVATYNSTIALPALWILQQATDLFDDDEEEKVKKENEQIAAAVKWNSGENYDAFRSALPEYVHGGVQVLRDLGDGRYVFTGAQRFDPAMAGALLEAAAFGDEDDFKAVLADTFFQMTPTAPAIGDVISGYFNYLSSEKDSVAAGKALDEANAGWGKLKEAFTPGSIKTLMRTDKAAEQGVELTAREKILNNVGMTVQIFDSNKAASRIAANYNGAQRDTSRSVKDQMEDGEPELDFHAPTLRKLAVWERARDKMSNLKQMGMDLDEVYAAVKNDPISKGISEAELWSLYENQFALPNYIEMVENSHKNAIVKAGADTAKVEELYLSYLKQAQEADAQMRTILESQGVQVQ